MNDSLPQTKALTEAQKQAAEEFKKLIGVVAALRGPDGCPWDKEQTARSLTQYAIEEAYELAEAIEAGSLLDVREELGDFLFQVVLHCQVAEDDGQFSLKDVIQQLTGKMIYRHPHVFANTGSRSLEEVWKHWEKLKASEKPKVKPVFSYPRKMPALQAAHKIGVKAHGFNFDWGSAEGVFEKVREEFHELEGALAAKKDAEIEHEIGDLLFSVAQLARHLKKEPEQILREANRRFELRFNKVLEVSGLDRDRFRELPAEQMQALWQKAKSLLAKT